MVQPFKIYGSEVMPGERQRLQLKTSMLYDRTQMVLPVEVVHGRHEGPILFVSGAIHGDEINGAEIVRQLLVHPSLIDLRGTLIAIPIVNVFGYNSCSRYMPDRRDLNRSFPGSKKGSMTAQLAYTFMQEIVKRSDYGIDFHTASINYNNLPQVRANLDNAEVKRLAKSFGVKILLNSKERDGSLRQSASETGVPILLFEGGTALRHSKKVSEVAVQGTLNVMRELRMLPREGTHKKKKAPLIAEVSHWVRASMSGSLELTCRLGERVAAQQLLGKICDPFGESCIPVYAPYAGMIIGKRSLPLVNLGDALFHLATETKLGAKEQEALRNLRELEADLPPLPSHVE